MAFGHFLAKEDSIELFRFENKFYLEWIFLLPIFWGFFVFFQRKTRLKLNQLVGQRLGPFLTQSVSLRKRQWKQFLQTLVFVFAVLSLARPQMGESEQKIKSEGIEVLLLVDVSESMMADDVKPNRLEQAKIELSRLVDLAPGNKYALVAFAGSAALLCPLTNDPGAVKMYLESLTTDSVSSQGTNFESALEEADQAFKRGGVSEDESSKATRVILVASDGEDQEQGALEKAQKLGEEGTRIYTIAYGTEKGASIPVRDGMGYQKGYKKDRSGQTIITSVKGDFLKQLAESGKGSFYFAVFGGDHMKSLNDEFVHLEKTLFDSKMSVQYDEKFQIFLLFAFVIGLIELLLGERKLSARLWRGRFEVSES